MKKFLLILLFFFPLLLSSLHTFSQCVTYDVQACIDGSDKLHIQGTQMWWEHLSFTPPGQHSNCFGVLYVNGNSWNGNQWNVPYTIQDVNCNSVSVNTITCYNSCSVIQTGNAGNNWETIYLMDDNAPGGSHVYEVSFTFCPLASANAGSDVSYCSGGTSSIGSAPVGGSSYSWSPTGGLSSSTVSNPTVFLSNATSSSITQTYTVTATDASGCTATDNADVTVFPLPASTFSVLTTVCVNEVVTVTYTGTASVSANYIWNFGSANVLSGSGQGPYQVLWSNYGTQSISLNVIENGCASSTTTQQVTVNPPNSDAGPDVIFCSGSSASLGTAPTSGFSYLWSPTAGLSNDTVSNPTITLTNLSAANQTFNYVVTTSFGSCVVSDTVVVTVKPNPVSDAGADVSYCSGSSVTIGAASTAGYTYAWSPAGGLSSTTISNPSVNDTNSSQTPFTTNYIVTTTLNNCVTTDTVSVTVYQVPTSNFTATAQVCGTDSASITYTGNATANATYTWNFDSGNILSGSGQGPYGVSWTTTGTKNISLTVSENNCTSTITLDSVIVYQVPTSVFTAPSQVCGLGNATITYTGNASANATYTWNFSGGGVVNGTGQGPYQVNWTSTGVKNISLTVTENNCTSVTTTIPLTVYPMPTSTFNLPSQACGTDTAIITYTGTASANANYVWTFDSGNANPGTGQGPQNVSWTTTGVKNITLTVTENNCTSITTTGWFTVYPIPVSIAGNDVMFCSGGSDSLGTGVTPGYSYSWNPGAGLSSATVSNPTVSLTDSLNSVSANTYVVTTTANNCTSADTVIVSVVPIPVAGFSVPGGQCLQGNNFLFTAGGTFLPAATFQWNFGNAAPATSSFQNPTGIVFPDSGAYPVLLTIAQFGCTSNVFVDSVMIFPMPLLFSFAPKDSVGCEPFTVNFTSSVFSNEPSVYQWDFGNAKGDTARNPQYTYQLAGIYNVSVKITSVENCSTTVAVGVITVNPKPVAEFIYSPEIITNLHPVVEFTDESSASIQSWQWNFGDGTDTALQNPTHSFPDTGEYFVSLIVTNIYGCLNTVIDTVIVLSDYNFFAPNAFTPNGNGHNDFFMPQGIGIDPAEFEMLIYNRWGNLIFQTQNPDNPWDGTQNGKPVKEDVYEWVVNLRDVFKKSHNYTGKVTLIR